MAEQIEQIVKVEQIPSEAKDAQVEIPTTSGRTIPARELRKRMKVLFTGTLESYLPAEYRTSNSDEPEPGQVLPIIEFQRDSGRRILKDMYSAVFQGNKPGENYSIPVGLLPLVAKVKD